MASLILLMASCGEKKSDSKPAQDSTATPEAEARIAPESPDYDLFQIKGDIEYVVHERFMDLTAKNLEQGDSIRFDDKGFWIGRTTWSGSGRERTVYEDIRLSYNGDGEFIEGKDVATTPQMKVVLERNDSLYLTSMSRLDGGDGSWEDASYTKKWEWLGSRQKRNETSGYGWHITNRFSYPEEGMMPKSAKRTTEDEGGLLEESIKFEYTAIDPNGNWTERKVHIEERSRDYDVETGSIVQNGEVKRRSYLERRRIGYRH